MVNGLGVHDMVVVEDEDKGVRHGGDFIEQGGQQGFGRRWLWGVQWHPENLVTMASQRALLERFRDQVAARAAVSADAEAAVPALR